MVLEVQEKSFLPGPKTDSYSLSCRGPFLLYDFTTSKAIAFSKDDKSIARMVDSQGITQASINRLDEEGNINGETSPIPCAVPVTSIAFGPRIKRSLSWAKTPVTKEKGYILATGHRDGSIRLWDSNDTQIITKLLSHTGQVNDVVFISRDDDQYCKLVSISSDHTIKVWDEEEYASFNMSFSKTVRDTFATSCDFNPHGQLLAIGVTSCKVYVYAVNERDDQSDQAERITQRMRLFGHKAGVTRCKYSSDGAFLISSSSDMRIIVWDSYTGDMWQSFCHVEPPPSVFFSGSISDVTVDPTFSTVTSVSSEAGLNIWNVDNSLPVFNIDLNQTKGRISSTFSHNGKWLAIGGNMDNCRIYTVSRPVPRLTHLARLTIRKSFKKTLVSPNNMVNALRLPNSIKSYLKYLE